MLKDNQEILIRHLIRFHILDYESCLQVLDTENTGDKVALSYVFRPLTKQKYIIKDKDGIVSVLKKGKELFPEEEPLISIGGWGSIPAAYIAGVQGGCNAGESRC